MQKSKIVKRRTYKGRSALIHKLHASGMSKAVILEAVRVKYPDTTPKVIKDVCAAKPMKAPAPVKAPAKSKTPPPKRAAEQIAEGRAKLAVA